MINFFKELAKGIFGFLFFAFMVGYFVLGIIICYTDGRMFGIDFDVLGSSVIIGGWLSTIFVFSIAGSFLNLVNDVAEIRKKLVDGKNTGTNTSAYVEQPYDEEPKTYDEFIKRLSDSNSASTAKKFWDCPKCGCTNSTSNSYCEKCGTPKP